MTTMPPVRPALRVLYVVSLFPCWSETFIVREIQCLMARGVDVRIVSLKHPCEEIVQSDAHALLDRVLYPPRGLALVRGWLREALRAPLRSLGELAQVTRGLWRHPTAWAKSLVVWQRTLGLIDAVRSTAPDRLHAHWATYPSTAAMWLSARLSRPFSFTAHAHDIFLEDHLLAEKMQRAAFGVTISEYNRRFLAERVSPRALQVMRVVHCGVSPADYPFRPDHRTAGRLLSVGRLDAIKGFDVLIDACARLRDRGVSFECRIVGDGPLRGMLQARIEAAGLGAQVLLLGACPQERVRAEQLAAQVFVLASVVTPQGDRDGIPVALMEAMACGTPVVSTQVSGIPELVTHGIEGLLAEAADAGDLAACIAQQLADPVRGRAMAEAARRKIEAQFDLSREVEKLHAALL